MNDPFIVLLNAVIADKQRDIEIAIERDGEMERDREKRDRDEEKQRGTEKQRGKKRQRDIEIDVERYRDGERERYRDSDREI